MLHASISSYLVCDICLCLCLFCFLFHPVSPNVISVTYQEEAHTLTCVSTGSPATTVSWGKDGVPLSIDGSTYQLTQTITDRVSSTYSNVLTVSETAPTGIAGTYTCTVSNDLGTDSSNVTVVGE